MLVPAFELVTGGRLARFFFSPSSLLPAFNRYDDPMQETKNNKKRHLAPIQKNVEQFIGPETKLTNMLYTHDLVPHRSSNNC